jgi:hypothetical protein
MLDQLDRIQVTTPILTLPCSSPFSYMIGPLDPAQFTILQAHLETGEEYSLLVPIHLPLALFIDPLFKDGYECGYLEGDVTEEWSVPRLVNWTYNSFNEEFYSELAWDELGLHLPAWTVGWILGSLAQLAETDCILALVGLAHLCFLLPLLTLDSTYWPPCNLRRADFLHRLALRSYREQVRIYREQDKSFADAQLLALVANA